MKRRNFLKASAAFAGAAAGGFGCIATAGAAPIEVPVVDKLSVRMLVDVNNNFFLRPATLNGVSLVPATRSKDYTKALHSEFGLSLYLESARAGETRTMMLDYAYTPETLLSNFDYLGLDARKIDALIVSHGHFDHYGGLSGFLDKYRDSLPTNIKLYAGGEDNFCHRVLPAGTVGMFSDFGYLDRRVLAAKNVAVVLCENPTVIGGHAFTTGQVKRRTDEKILPNTFEEFGIKDGLGCDPAHFAPAAAAGRPVADEHYHEHATVFNVKNRGLVVISSCSHRGVVNAVRQAQEVSGIEKLHALVGGFHLAPAPMDYARHITAEILELNPDVVVPMHCSGENFVQAMTSAAPDRLLLAASGSQLTFGG
jgi:7,8-dihydropterin-6-yl-methyl-4-(beta-D-ribofuranosyl)aminobenzene 5'-phosphate synthase